MEIGCNSTFLSNFRSKEILKINISRTPNSKGSVGKYISKLKPGTISFRGIESGVKKTININNLSKEKTARNNTRIPTGIRLKKYNCLYIKYPFNKINRIEKK
ncbi:MAG: hypothetical protein ABIJ97_00410 [Bacteroidota bacterium]